MGTRSYISPSQLIFHCFATALVFDFCTPMSLILEKLASLCLALRSVPKPVAAHVNYVRGSRLLFLSGGLPIDGEEEVNGKVED